MIDRAVLSPRVALQIRNLADIAVLSVEQQHSRIVPSELGPIDLAAPRTQLIFPRLEMAARAADIDLYVVALHRLMRIGQVALKKTDQASQLLRAVQRFQSATRGLNELRDTLEHIDEYAFGEGKRQHSGESTFTFLIQMHADGATVSYGRHHLRMAKATPAARCLHRAIRAAVDEVAATSPQALSPLLPA